MKYAIALLFFCCLGFAEEPDVQTFSRPPKKKSTVDAQPWVKNGVAAPYFVIDFIYWKVREEGLEYARKGVGDAMNPVTSKGKVFEPRFDGKPGFRAGLGLNLGHDGWDIFFRYTWLYTHIKDAVSVDPAREFLEPLWVQGSDDLLIGGLRKGATDWDLHTNILDLEWGRHYYISPYLTLRPFFGFKGFWLDQKNQLEYLGFTNEARTISAVSQISLDQKAWGFGIRFGMQTSWYFTRNWSVFGDAALTAAWGKFDLDRKDQQEVDSSGSDVTLAHLGYDQYAMTPILELGVGLRWEVWFRCDQYHALIQVGWEEQVWWDFNRFPHIEVPFLGMGNLQYQGLTARFRFDF